MAAVLQCLYSSFTNRISRLMWISMAAVAGEGPVPVLNAMRCPLTDLVEDFDSSHGSVSDNFLPSWADDWQLPRQLTH